MITVMGFLEDGGACAVVLDTGSLAYAAKTGSCFSFLILGSHACGTLSD